VTFAAVALKLAVVACEGTTTEAGTVKAEGMLLARATVAPPAAAAEDRVTAQVVAAFGARVVFTQLTDDSDDGPEPCVTRERFVLTLVPFRLPVTVAVWLVVNEPAVALKVAVEEPAGIESVAGTATPFVALSVAVAAAETAALSVAVHTATPLGARAVGLQLIRVRKVPPAGVMVPPLVLTVVGLPEGSELSPLAIPIAADADPWAKVIAARATIPFEIPVEFMPLATHT
jgi:hypothetical protein